ncbi:MAG: DNA polymerase III subunit gamma/tau [Bacteroides sp.]|nr:DNA polymerase III subunit gamma/tau [Bacillota bacterium]MCM1455263.1 DNA polymerase III subunit gamma/tau [Bacteroides sp.]
MAYTSLYRKYRPDTFDKVIGQDHIVRTLKNQIAHNNVGHAYIFTGTRGTGKTSVAKIFAKAVNCLSPIDGSPCGKCENCVALSEPSNFDVLEIDAASNNSVDQIRDLTDKINFPPTVGRYKVYIVDEVHMLSKAAFNALLKTLEEPPEHAIFILATTEIHQIPATILSRCLRFDFRLIPNGTLVKHVKYVFDDIGVKYENEALDLIASAGAGSVRDMLSVADTCVSYCDGNITYNGVLEVLGASDPKKLQELGKAIADGDTDAALKTASALCDLGKSIPVLANDLATLFRNVLFIKTCTSARELLALPESIYGELSEMAKKYPASRLMSIMKAMSGLEGELRYSVQHRILFEGALVAACLGVEDGANTADLQARIARLEKIVAGLRQSGFKSAPAIKDAQQVWLHLASELKRRRYNVIALALQEAKFELSEEEFRINVPDRATYNLVSEKGNRDMLNEVFKAEPMAQGLRLVVSEVKHINEDKAVPYIREMFGDAVEIE